MICIITADRINRAKMSNNAMDTIARLLAFFDFFIRFFKWFDGQDCVVRTGFQAGHAARAFIRMHYFGMFMPQEIYFANNF
jgi:hypothetical protein